jgi:hypothetical protein
VLGTSCSGTHAGHLELLQCYEAGADELIQLGQKSLNFVFGVNDLNNRGKVPWRIDIEFEIQAAIMAVTQRPVENGGAGETSLQRRFDNCTIKNAPSISIGLADEHTEKNSVSKRFHVPLSMIVGTLKT